MRVIVIGTLPASLFNFRGQLLVSFLEKTKELTAMASGANAFEGKGEINNTDRIDTKFGARVVDVMPNNTLIIEGVRRVSHTKETQTIILRATVRLEDIEADNSVISYKLADVSLRYINTGVASDAQNKGWFTRIWDKVSPF